MPQEKKNRRTATKIAVHEKRLQQHCFNRPTFFASRMAERTVGMGKAFSTNCATCGFFGYKGHGCSWCHQHPHFLAQAFFVGQLRGPCKQLPSRFDGCGGWCFQATSSFAVDDAFEGERGQSLAVTDATTPCDASCVETLPGLLEEFFPSFW